ncbi:MAG: BTAD domain-containing putative transcriptional regulator [Anaerolineae bacterium]|jgi:DNA-binding SARP family transcriptional activator/predicted ATPase
MARLSLSLLGPFQVTLDGQPVTDFKSNKVRALLAYLAVEADRPHHREVLAGLLWPDWPDRDALSNLRYTLSDLRRAIGDRTVEPSFLLITRDTLEFNAASDHWLDVAGFADLVSSLEDPSALKQAIALYRGSFLEGFSVGDSAAFEEWVLFTRERLARQMSSVLHHLAVAYEQQGEYDQAESFARRHIELEPWAEGVHRQLMRTLALDGKRGAALAQYETCRRLLTEELAVEPAAETTALYERIRDGELIAPVVSPAPPPVPSASLPPFLATEGSASEEPPVFVARERELARLDCFLDRALAGQGQVVFVTGDAGSGKTALLHAFARRAQEAHPDLLVAGGQGNAHTGIGDPYLPFREILCLLTGDVEAQWAAGAMTREQARRLWQTLPLAAQALVQDGPDLIDTFVPRAALLKRAVAYGVTRAGWLVRLKQPGERTPDGVSAVAGPLQSDLFEQYTRVLQALTQRGPLLLVVDDLQWADLGSTSLLFHLGRQLVGSRLLITGSYRPEEVALGRPGPARGAEQRERHPLEPVVSEFQRDFGDITVNLGAAASREFVDALLDSEPNLLGHAFREMLHRQTRGHPLFTVELLRGLQEQGDLLRDPEGRWVEGPALDWEALPARVEAVVAERINRLAEPLRAALQVASVEGEVFTAEVVARVQGVGERDVVMRLSRDLDRRHRLVRAQGIQRMDGRRLSQYRFRHILFQRYLYGSLDDVERSYLHEAIGDTLEALYEGQPETMLAMAGQLAWHFQEAGIVDKAIHYLRQAGERAVQLSAYREARTQLTTALDLLLTLPDSPERAQKELPLQISLGMAWQGTDPHEAEKAYKRARELSLQTGLNSDLYLILGQLSTMHYVGAKHHSARELVEETIHLAEQTADPLLEAIGHWRLGFILFALGDFAASRAHLEQMLAFYEPQYHRSLVFLSGADGGPSAMAYHACCLWALGYPEQASKRSEEALALAMEFDHPFTLADVLTYGGCLFQVMLRNASALLEHAEALVQLATERGFANWLAYGIVYRGQALVMLGEVEEGMAQLREGVAAHEAFGAQCYLVNGLYALAKARALAGQPEEGLAILHRALAIVEETDERQWEVELRRLRAELLLMLGQDADAEATLQHAIEVARGQSAKSWELRATMSLAHLWHQQGRNDEAHRMLAEIYGWFTEGFDTPDLQEAKALLEELA